MSLELLREYGVLHLKGALTAKEQEELFRQVKDQHKDAPGTSGKREFHVSRKTAWIDCSVALYSRS